MNFSARALSVAILFPALLCISRTGVAQSDSAKTRADWIEASRKIDEVAPNLPSETKSTAKNTSLLLRNLADKDLRLSPELVQRINAAALSASALEKGAGSQNIESILQVEKQLVLAYWETGTSLQTKTAMLSANQLGYIFAYQFQNIESSSGPTSSELELLLKEGKRGAMALARATSMPRSEELAALLSSLETARDFSRSSGITPDVIASLSAINSSLDHHLSFFQQKGKANVQVTVKTVRTDGNRKQEAPGYRIRYELQADYSLRTYKNKRLDGITNPARGTLGPYTYVFWAEKEGKTTSQAEPWDLGEPLKEVRELEIEVVP